MSRVSMTLAGAAAVLLFVAMPAVASQDVESELAEMRALVQGLQQKVEAQEEQLAHQGEMLEDAQQVVKQTQQDQDALSGLAKFLDAVEFDGNVAGSYFWNTNQPDQPAGGAGGNTGFSGAFYPYHPDHNSFQVDQVWFGMGKPATEESRAGFQFDLIFGQTASSVTTLSQRLIDADSASDLYVHQAYVEYLAPVGDGANLTVGKFAAITGAESLDGTKNFNITHSNIYNMLLPIDHVGVMASSQAGPVELTFGYVNSTTTRTIGRVTGAGLVSSPDDNKEKSYILGAGFEQDNMEFRGTLLYGAEAGQNGTRNGLLDVVFSMDPSDELSLWVVGDYAWVDGARPAAWGLGAAARMALDDKTGVSLRGEYLKDKSNSSRTMGFLGVNSGAGPGVTSEIYALTGTVDYTVVENLVVRGEVRWDQVRERDATNEFPKGTTHTLKNQVTLGAQVVYNF